MFGLLRLLLFLALVAGVLWFGSSVKLGNHTLFGHIERIWKTDEAQDLVQGAKEKAGPAVDKLKKGVEAGWREANRPDDASTGDTGPGDAGVGMPR